MPDEFGFPECRCTDPSNNTTLVVIRPNKQCPEVVEEEIENNDQLRLLVP
jgi:hypothetical protein